MAEQHTAEKLFRERQIVCTPSLTATLTALQPGDYVHCGKTWAYGTIRQMASNLGVSIQTKRTSKGITILRTLEVPEPK